MNAIYALIVCWHFGGPTGNFCEIAPGTYPVATLQECEQGKKIWGGGTRNAYLTKYARIFCATHQATEWTEVFPPLQAQTEQQLPNWSNSQTKLYCQTYHAENANICMEGELLTRDAIEKHWNEAPSNLRGACFEMINHTRPGAYSLLFDCIMQLIAAGQGKD